MTGKEITAYDEAWAQQAQQYAEQEAMQGGVFLSTRGGVLKFGEEELPGNQACVIVLDTIKENTLYDGKFDPNQLSSPICYAFGRGQDDMGPHPSMQNDLNYFKPQSDTCEACPHNVWGSADTGRGKACQNRRRLALIPAGYYAPKRGSRDFDLEVFADPAHYARADIAYIKLPVLSVKNWSKYVTSVAATERRPPHGVITRMFIEPDPKAQYCVHFEMLEQLPTELAAVVMARHEEALKAVIQGYRPPEEKQPPQGSLRGMRRAR